MFRMLLIGVLLFAAAACDSVKGSEPGADPVRTVSGALAGEEEREGNAIEIQATDAVPPEDQLTADPGRRVALPARSLDSTELNAAWNSPSLAVSRRSLHRGAVTGPRAIVESEERNEHMCQPVSASETPRILAANVPSGENTHTRVSLQERLEEAPASDVDGSVQGVKGPVIPELFRY